MTPPSCNFHTARMVSLYFGSGGLYHRELGLSVAAHGHRFKHFDAAVSLAAILVSGSVARHFALGSSDPASWRSSRLHRSSSAGNCYCGAGLDIRSGIPCAPKLLDDRNHRPLVLQRALRFSLGQVGSRAGTPLAMVACPNNKESCRSATWSAFHTPFPRYAC